MPGWITLLVIGATVLFIVGLAFSLSGRYRR